MATRNDLEDREPHCSSAAEFLEIAGYALQPPADPGYARQLANRSETLCRTPHEFVTLAEFAVQKLHDARYGNELFAAAASIANTVEHRLLIAASGAHHGLDANAIAHNLQHAAALARDRAQQIAIARCARRECQNLTLADDLLQTALASTPTLDNHLQLIRDLLAADEPELAQLRLTRASRLCASMPALIDYAQAQLHGFNDAEGALSTLGDAEADCQSTAEFTTLATAYQNLFMDQTRVAELMELAEEYALTADDQLDLARACWRDLSRPEHAETAYRNALNLIASPDRLIDIGSEIATGFGPPALALSYLHKAQQAARDDADIMRIATVMQRHAAAPDQAGATLIAAAVATADPAAIARLAEHALTLGRPADAERIYRHGLSLTAGCESALNIANALLNAGLPDAIVRDAVTTAETHARIASDFLRCADLVGHALRDAAWQRNLLRRVLGQIADLDELDAVSHAINQAFPDDPGWQAPLTRIRTRLAQHREHYQWFQRAAATTTAFHALLQTARLAQAQLADPNLARKLLLAAEQRLPSPPHADSAAHGALITTIGALLDDPAWVLRHLDQLAQRSPALPSLVAACELAKRVLPAERAADWIRQRLAAWERRPNPADNDIAPALQLANAVMRLSNDADRAQQLLQRLTLTHEQHRPARLHIALTAQALGLTDIADEHTQAALHSAADITELRSITATLLNGYRGAQRRHWRQRIREAYGQTAPAFARPLQKLLWIEGLVRLFGDADAAQREYLMLRRLRSNGLDAARFDHSYRTHIARTP